MAGLHDDVTFDPEVTRPVVDPGMTRAVTTGAVSPPPATPRATDFAPGAIIAGRYRLVALLGRGGMGEVHRADDLTLDQPVALKFLSAAVAAGDDRLSQFHNELRVARQVSHKNVCRLYDLGEADGRRFLTMEYVDGEDLGSLLRRIGRIPHDKAVQIARQLCAGVAAAHDRGVVHRDLKPANVMIDGQGDVRITDFGIATAAAEDAAKFAGTPQYMAPEQFAGAPASIKSDIYALGLTLFEVFTGRRAHESKTLADLKAFHETGTLPTPSSIVRDLDPAVERLIVRCLDRDPARRPASALVVAASLPGADPLAAALAAGETPSPEILAAAGEADALGVKAAVLSLVLVIAGLVIFASVSARTSIVGRTTLDKAPAVLIDRAEQILASLGYPASNGDRVSSFVMDDAYLDWIRQTRPQAQRWEILSKGDPSGVHFWYRTSPGDMVPVEDSSVSMSDPPLDTPDMRLVVLDPQGRLRGFRSVPPRTEPDAVAVEPRWDALFEAAGWPITSFTAIAPAWTPRDYADARAAWKGPLPGNPEMEVRIEAAAYRGRPVAFQVIGPWERRTESGSRPRSRADNVLLLVVVAVVTALMAAAMLLARRNVRAGRADRRGAARLAAYLGLASAVAWIVGAHHIASLDGEISLLVRSAGLVSFFALILWVVYIALEPYVRRFWPDSLLGWSRLLAGHIKDPRVGRDVLIGLLFGVALGLNDLTRTTIFPWLGYAPRPTFGSLVDLLPGGGAVFAAWIGWSLGAIQSALFTVLIIVVLRLALPWKWLTVVVTSVLLMVTNLNYGGGGGPWILLLAIASGGLLTLVALRFGLLPLIVTFFVWNVVRGVPITLAVSHWSAAASNWTLAGLVGLALFGFYASRAGQPLFGSILRE